MLLWFPDTEQTILGVAGEQVLVGVVGQTDNILLVHLVTEIVSD